MSIETIYPSENILPLDIAITALRRCYYPNNIFPIIRATSSGRFSSHFWLRDGVIGGWGALAIGEEQDINMVTGVLTSIFKPGSKNPYRIKHLPKNKQETNVPLIKRLCNPSLLIFGERPEIADSFLPLSLAGRYLSSEKVNKDEATYIWWTQKDQMFKLCRYYLQKLEQNDGLINEVPLASRQDSVLKSGAVLLTNLLLLKTLEDLADGVKHFDDKN